MCVICAAHTCSPPQRLEEYVGSLGTSVTVEHVDTMWVLGIQSSRKKKSKGLLTSEPSLQPLKRHFCYVLVNKPHMNLAFGAGTAGPRRK